MSEHISASTVKQEIIQTYPTKLARRRMKQIIVNDVKEDENVPEIQANTRTIPGIITIRGSAYAGCKGVVLGPPETYCRNPRSHRLCVSTVG